MTASLRPLTLAIALAASALPAVGRAGSVAVQNIWFAQAVTMSPRVVKGTVKARSAAKIDGGTFDYIEIAAGAALKGPPAKAGEHILAFDGAAWFQHTHAAAIKGGIVSYADARYATPLSDAEIKPGAAVIVFLRGEAPPPGFPAGAAFLSCRGCIDRAERAADVARTKTAAFGDPITLEMGEVAVLPDGLEVEVKGHTRKRPIGGATATDTAQVEARRGTQRTLLVLGDRRLWQQYEIVLVAMKQGADTTLRVLLKNP